MPGLLAGVNFMLHACGLAGRRAGRESFEKFVLDADQLGILHKMAAGCCDGPPRMRAGHGRDPRGGAGRATTLAAPIRRPISRPRSGGRIVLDYKPFETWDEEGARDTQALASARVTKLLGDYQQPGMDPGTAEALAAYVARRRKNCRIRWNRHQAGCGSNRASAMSAISTSMWRRTE